MTATAFVPARHPARRGRWSRQRVLEALIAWREETGRAPRRADWTGERMHAAGAAQRKWMREHPRWPSSTCVARHHGSWSAALERAGLAAVRLPGHAGVTARVLEARALRWDGLDNGAIARELGVSASTVARYLAATPCPGCRGPVVAPRAERCSTCAGREPAAPSAWTRARCLHAIRAWHAETGRPPRMTDWTPSRSQDGRWAAEWPRWPSATVVRRVFADDPAPWRAALHAASADEPEA